MRLSKNILLVVVGLVTLLQPASGAEPAELKWDVYSGYFVSNKFEPDKPESYLVIQDKKRFDEVFGVAATMWDKSHRLPDGAFKSLVVVTAIKRGRAFWEYTVQGVTVDEGVVQLRYTAVSDTSGSATFACPLIVSIPKGKYKAVQFIENGKTIKQIPGP